MMKCKECRDFKRCLIEALTRNQIFDAEYEGADCFTIISNADHIRSMSDEELARELIWIQQDAYTLGDRMRNIDDSKYPLSKAEWMEWLSEPYKEKEE